MPRVLSTPFRFSLVILFHTTPLSVYRHDQTWPMTYYSISLSQAPALVTSRSRQLAANQDGREQLGRTAAVLLVWSAEDPLGHAFGLHGTRLQGMPQLWGRRPHRSGDRGRPPPQALAQRWWAAPSKAEASRRTGCPPGPGAGRVPADRQRPVQKGLAGEGVLIRRCFHFYEIE